jgi:hypothetical protein
MAAPMGRRIGPGHDETPTGPTAEVSGANMTRYQTGHTQRTRSALRAQIAVQRDAVLRKATRVEPPYTQTTGNKPAARIVGLDDHILVIGVPTPEDREHLSQTHVEQHRHLGGTVWFPKGADDAA